MEIFKRWTGMEKRGFIISITRTKLTGKNAKEKFQSGKWPCSCCRECGYVSLLLLWPRKSSNEKINVKTET